MRLQRFAASWRIQLLVALALVHDAGCGGATRSDVKCGSDPVLLAGQPTGLQSCSGHVVHRAKSVACTDPFPRAVPSCISDQPDSDSCNADSECASMNGVGQPFCGLLHGKQSFCTCDVGCLSDADCQSGQACVCGDPIGTCTNAACATDADCPGSSCTAEVHANGVTGEFACVSPDDECEVDSDCPSKVCAFDDTLNARACVASSGGGCFGSGRPFLVAGGARTSALADRADWGASETPAITADLPLAEREAVAAGWARAGLMEHASIAAFARFTLQLLSLGAPADLVRDAQAAMADEIEHARVCFSLASAHAGRSIGPGPLSLAGALDGGSAREILATAILEGCVGETVAALEAHELAERASDPSARRALITMAADEARHAELAWRFVKWAVEQDPAMAAVAASTFARAESESASRAVAASSGPDLSAHGIATASMRREIERCAVAQVVSPCAAALLSSTEQRQKGLEPRPSGSGPEPRPSGSGLRMIP
jgi:hypothetical protein